MTKCLSQVDEMVKEKKNSEDIIALISSVLEEVYI